MKQRIAIFVAVFAVAYGALIATGVGTAPGATPSCDLTIPPVQKLADGVKVGKVTGQCGFRWHSTNQITLDSDNYLARWRVLGSRSFDGGKPGVQVTQPGWSEDYYGCGRWRYRVIVQGMNGEWLTYTGPARRFCAS